MEEQRRISGKIGAPEAQSRVGVANHNAIPAEETKKLREGLEKLPLSNAVNSEGIAYEGHAIDFQLPSTDVEIEEEDLTIRKLPRKFNTEATSPQILKDFVHNLKEKIADDIQKQRAKNKQTPLDNIDIKIHPHIRTLCEKLIKDLSQQVEHDPEVLVTGNLKFSNNNRIETAIKKFKRALSYILSAAKDDQQIQNAIETCGKNIIHEFKYRKGKLIHELTGGLSDPLIDARKLKEQPRPALRNCYIASNILYTKILGEKFEELIETSKNSDEVLSKLKVELAHGLEINPRLITGLSEKYEVRERDIEEFLMICAETVQAKINLMLATREEESDKEHKEYSEKLESHFEKLRYKVLTEQKPDKLFSSGIRSNISLNDHLSSSIKFSGNGSSIIEEPLEENRAPQRMEEVREEEILRQAPQSMVTVVKEAVINHLKSVLNSGRNLQWYSRSKRDSLKSEILNLKIKLTDEVTDAGESSDKTLRELGFDVNLSKLNFAKPNSFSLEFTLPDLDHVSSSQNLFKTARETVFSFKINLTPELRRMGDEDEIFDENGKLVSGKTGWKIQTKNVKDYEAATEDTDSSSIEERILTINEESEIASAKKMPLRTHKNVGRRMYEALLLSIKVSPDSNGGSFGNILNIFTQTPVAAYIAVTIIAVPIGVFLLLSGVGLGVLIPIFLIPVMLPIFLWVTRLFTNLSVGLMKNMTDVSLLENTRKRDRASAILSGVFWVVITAGALALNTVKGVFSFNNNYFTTARIDGTEKLIREIRLLRVLEAITGLSVIVVYTALGIVAGLAISLSNAGALGFIAAAASPGLMTWMSPIIVLMATSPVSLTLILTLTAIATAFLGSKIAYDLFIMFIKPIISKYRSDKKLETASELAARLINGTNSRPPELGLVGEELFLPLIELLQNDYVEYDVDAQGQLLLDEARNPKIRRRWNDLTDEEKKLLLLKHAVGANYILDQYRTLLELKKVIQQARAENPETTIAKIISQLNDSGDVHIGLYLQSICPNAKDRNDPKILDAIENNLNRSIGMLMPFVSVKSQIIKEEEQEERSLTSSEYRAKVKQAKTVEEFYTYVEMPKAHKRSLNAILNKHAVLAEKLKSVSPRQYRIWQEKIRYGQWASDLFNRELEEKALFLNYVTVVEGRDTEQSISKKIKLYLPDNSNRLLETFDREKIYNPKLVKNLRKKRPGIKSMDGLKADLLAKGDKDGAELIYWEQDHKFSKDTRLMPRAVYITKELVIFIDDEYKELSAELQDLRKRLKTQEMEIFSRKNLLQKLLAQSGNTVNRKVIAVQSQIDRIEQNFALLLHQASICEKIIHYDENLLSGCAKQTLDKIDDANIIAGIEDDRKQYQKIHEDLKELELEGHFLSPIISHTSMLDESYNFIEARATAISENAELILETYQECSLHRIKTESIKEAEKPMLLVLDGLPKPAAAHLDKIPAETAKEILAQLLVEEGIDELPENPLPGLNTNVGLARLLTHIKQLQALPEAEYTQELSELLRNNAVVHFINTIKIHVQLNQNYEADQEKMMVLRESEEQILIKLERAKSTLDYLQKYCERHTTISAKSAQTMLTRYRNLLPLDADMSELLSDLLYGANGNKGLTFLMGCIDDIKSHLEANDIRPRSETEYTQEFAKTLEDPIVENFILALEAHVTNDQHATLEIKSLVLAFKNLKRTSTFIAILKTKFPELLIKEILTKNSDELIEILTDAPENTEYRSYDDIESFIVEFKPRHNLLIFMKALQNNYGDKYGADLDGLFKNETLKEIKDFLKNIPDQNAHFLNDLDSFIEIIDTTILNSDVENPVITKVQLMEQLGQYETEKLKNLKHPIERQKAQMDEVRDIAKRMVERATVNNILDTSATLEFAHTNFKTEIVKDMDHIAEKIKLLITEIIFDIECLEKTMPVYDSKNFEPEVTFNNPNLSVCKSRAPIEVPKLSNEMLEDIEEKKQKEINEINSALEHVDRVVDQLEIYLKDDTAMYMIPEEDELVPKKSAARKSEALKKAPSQLTEQSEEMQSLKKNSELEESRIIAEEIIADEGKNGQSVISEGISLKSPPLSRWERFKRFFVTPKLTPEEKEVNKHRADAKVKALKQTYDVLSKHFATLSKRNDDRLYHIISGMVRRVHGDLKEEQVGYYKTLYNNTQQNIDKIFRRMNRIAQSLKAVDEMLDPIEFLIASSRHTKEILQNIHAGQFDGGKVAIQFNSPEMREEFKKFFGEQYPRFEKLIARIPISNGLPDTDDLEAPMLEILLEEDEEDQENRIDLASKIYVESLPKENLVS